MTLSVSLNRCGIMSILRQSCSPRPQRRQHKRDGNAGRGGRWRKQKRRQRTSCWDGTCLTISVLSLQGVEPASLSPSSWTIMVFTDSVSPLLSLEDLREDGGSVHTRTHARARLV